MGQKKVTKQKQLKLELYFLKLVVKKLKTKRLKAEPKSSVNLNSAEMKEEVE